MLLDGNTTEKKNQLLAVREFEIRYLRTPLRPTQEDPVVTVKTDVGTVVAAHNEQSDLSCVFLIEELRGARFDVEVRVIDSIGRFSTWYSAGQLVVFADYGTPRTLDMVPGGVYSQVLSSNINSNHPQFALITIPQVPNKVLVRDRINQWPAQYINVNLRNRDRVPSDAWDGRDGWPVGFDPITNQNISSGTVPDYPAGIRVTLNNYLDGLFTPNTTNILPGQRIRLWYGFKTGKALDPTPPVTSPANNMTRIFLDQWIYDAGNTSTTHSQTTPTAETEYIITNPARIRFTVWFHKDWVGYYIEELYLTYQVL